LTPGADTMFILGRSISQGKKAGILIFQTFLFYLEGASIMISL
jgi:threonine/homoserine/homoserine lactone efflux protein